MPTMDEFRKCKDAAAVTALYGPLTDRNFLVTGASGGLGFETASALAAAGGNVVMACRPGAKAEEAATKVRAVATAGAAVHLLPLDLTSTASVRASAKQFEALRPQLPRGGTLNALILNAGIIGMPFGAYDPDMEPQLQVNLLGHALLHDLLRPVLDASPDARVVVVASGSHYWINDKELDLSRQLPPRKEDFNYGRAYGFSNLCRILWAKALSRRVSYPVVSLHPAAVMGTGMGNNIGLAAMISILPRAMYYEHRAAMEGQSVAQGARTQTFVAVAPRETVAELSGKFLSGNTSDGPLGSPVTPSILAQRDDYAEAVFQFVNAFVEKERSSS